MLILILGLVFGLVVLFFLIRSVGKKSRERLRYGSRWEKIAEIIKIILLVETIAYVIIFAILLIKTIIVYGT